MRPTNKRERFLVGVKKSRKRIQLWKGSEEQKQIWAAQRRNTTKTCSCIMCGNPRKYLKGKNLMEKTRKEQSQEKEVPMF